MITRRTSIALTAKGVAALMALGPQLAACRAPGLRQVHRSTQATKTPSSGRGGLDWESFIQRVAELAQRQFSADWSQEAHVQEVTALMRMLNLKDDAFDRLYEGYTKATGSFPQIKAVHAQQEFKVVTVEFKPGDAIPLHNHPDMTGVIFCLAGTVQIEAFDLLTEASPSGKLKIKRCADQLLKPGEFSTLTAARGNIHALQATEHTELLDIFTPPYDPERFTRYRVYQRSEAPIEDGDVYEAWQNQ